MTEETWVSIAKRLDALDATEKRRRDRAAKKSVPVMSVDSRAETLAKQREAGQRVQARMQRQTEADYEAEMNERIITESAEIRAGWSEEEHARRRVGRKPEYTVPQCRCHSVRH